MIRKNPKVIQLFFSTKNLTKKLTLLPRGKMIVAIWIKGVCYYSAIEAMLLREDLADLMPMVNEANAISQELDRKVNYNATLS